MRLKMLICSSTFIAATSAMAISIDPTYTTFGNLPAAIFGGSGIPNNAVAITTLSSVNGSDTYSITLGLTAHQRYSNPAVVNDGAGTFGAIAGGDSNPNYARWNVGYYIDVSPNLSHSFFGGGDGYSVRLYYDKNPAIDNDVTSYVALEPNFFYGGLSFDSQNSWNLGQAPFAGAFDPNATGEYSFALAVLKDGTELGRSAINVNVSATGAIPATNVPDGGSSLALLGGALAGLGIFHRRAKRIA